ncbi:hypothetical protein [Paraburkholderia gardini]|uniref:hypothetical protein n=1 Tax=Paraburkholderia gardini TaxID=2823469 RepID=UPI001D946E34|nr:hypothetical protein [Paraburkholderia gardini]CAG4889562.1 hypothetical protein R69919_00772 [Paraburkholderia gardini]
MKICSIEGCAGPHSAKGMCPVHYSRMKRRDDRIARDHGTDSNSRKIKGKYHPIEKGQRFGILTAIQSLGKRNERGFWLFRCDCGNEIEKASKSVKESINPSCGCRPRSSTHGLRDKFQGSTRRNAAEYESYKSAIRRCYSQKCASYARYGGRGIKMCEKWKESFLSFLADMGKRPPGTSLERLDNNKNYEPENCVWATAKQQTRNRRDTVKIQFNESIIPLASAAELLGVSYAVAYRWMVSGELKRIDQ